MAHGEKGAGRLSDFAGFLKPYDTFSIMNGERMRMCMHQRCTVRDQRLIEGTGNP